MKKSKGVLKLILKIKKSLLLIDYKLIISLMFIQLVPTLYTTLRVFFLGQLPGEYSFSIAGQLTWINLLYEIINESIILPLYFFVGKASNNKKELGNCFKSGLLVTFLIYVVLALLIMLFIKPMLVIMSVNKDILAESATYIRIESIALIFSVISSFVLVVLVTLNKVKFMYILTGTRLILCTMIDTLLVSSLPCSLKLGVNGIAITNIIVNGAMFVISLALLNKEEGFLFAKQKLSFSWMKEFWKVGGISGIESFVRNFAYIVMISRMVNVVNEQGTYWVANNFIWGWLLLPITQLGEYIKKDVATDRYAIKNKTLGYFAITTVICSLWFVTIPLWKPFMTNILLFKDVDKLYNLVMILVGFYVLYAFQNVFDATFYGLGKTKYMLFESVVTNTLYYGTAFLLYITKIWVPTLTGIAMMFGIGMAFDSLVSLGAYKYLLKKNKINPNLI
jgi:Na+-driven multidrug efflux pump